MVTLLWKENAEACVLCCTYKIYIYYSRLLLLLLKLLRSSTLLFLDISIKTVRHSVMNEMEKR